MEKKYWKKYHISHVTTYEIIKWGKLVTYEMKECWILDLDLFVVLCRIQQPGSYCDG